MAIARYSGSVDDRETMLCLFDFPNIKESLMKMQNPVTNRRVSGQPTQSESKKLEFSEMISSM